MSSKRAPNAEILRSHEEAFVQHYKWLIRWALQFTHNDRARAEDLVQEVFAQFAFAHTDLSTINNVPAYLYAALRNTHLSAVRMAGRTHFQSQSIVDYSIADAALGANDPATLYQIHDQLRCICHYACLRKQSSRAGSVMILRFFYGYHISEVARVLGTTSPAVRQCLRFARNEARLFLEDPESLTFINRDQTVRETPARAIRSAEELLTDLRLAICRSCEGECFTTELLYSFYEKGAILTLDNPAIAHIVSCRKCLDSVNRKLGLPLLIERHPADALGPDNSWRGGQGGPGASGGTVEKESVIQSRSRRKETEQDIPRKLLQRCRQRARELYEHHPRELCVSVNGYLLGSHSVNSDVSRLRLDITIAEPLSFIEVLNEENARLLVMNVDAPPDGEPTQVRQVSLSEGRRIEVTLRYGHPWPMLEVVYEEPNFLAESQQANSDFRRIWGLSSVKPSSPELEPGPVLDQGLLAGRLATKQYLAHPDPGSVSLDRVKVTDTTHPPAAYSLARAWEFILSVCKRPAIVSRKISELDREPQPLDSLRALYQMRRPLWTRPGFLAGTLSLILISALLVAYLNNAPAVSAEKLLAQAVTAEMVTERSSRLAHRVIDIEERAHAGGTLLARARIQIWRDRGRDLSVRRLYNDKDELVAAEWLSKTDTGTAPSPTIYRRAESLASDSLAGLIREREIWQLEPSAKEYAEIIGRPDAAQVSEGATFYVVTYTGEQASNAGAVLQQATLTLRKSDLHPIAQTFLMKRGSDIREYRLTEARFAQPSIDSIAPKVFELDPELLPHRQGPSVKRDSDSVHSSSFNPSPSLIATPELEIEVAYILDQFRRKFGDQISLTRTAEGSLRVQGVVDTDATKQQILQALEPVLKNPAVTVQISTAAEELQRQQRGSASELIVRDFSGLNNTLPTYQDLRRYYTSRAGEPGQDDGTDQAARAFAARMVSTSRRMLSHAIELKQLSGRFSMQESTVLTPATRAKWLGLIRNHAAALQREAFTLDHELQPIFFPTDNFGPTTNGNDVASEVALRLAIQRVFQLTLSNDEAIRAAFTASSDTPGALALKTPRFRGSLHQLENLANGIRAFATNN